jgi:hypothetical protein
VAIFTVGTLIPVDGNENNEVIMFLTFLIRYNVTFAMKEKKTENIVYYLFDTHFIH